VTKKVFWAVVFILVAALLQSTIFARLSGVIRGIPDFSLVILVYASYANGSMTGELSGFFGGILIDFLSAAPLGFNALIRTSLGAAAGLLKGTFFLDPVFLPMALCAGATAGKALLCFLLSVLLAGAVPAYSLTHPAFWVELSINTLSAPFLFALLQRFKPLLAGGRGPDA